MKKTIWKWMISYLYVMVLPLAFGILIYMFSMNTIREEAEEIQYQTVDRSANMADNLLFTLSQMGAAILSDEKIQDLGRVENGQFNAVQRLNFQKVNATLMDYSISNDYISGIYLYFPRSQYLVGSKNLYYTYDEQVLRTRLGITVQTWNELLQDSCEVRLHLLDGVSRKVCLYIYGGNIYRKTGEQDVLMIAVLDCQKLLESIQMPETSVYLMLEDGSYLGTGAELSEEMQDALGKMEGKAYQYMTVGDSNLVLTRLEGKNLWLLHLMPREMFMGKLQQAKIILAVYVIICLVLDVLLSSILTKRNYSPVGELLKLTQQGEYRASGNVGEFQAIKDSVEKLIRVYRDQEEEKLSRDYQIRSNRMKRILENSRYAMVSEEEFACLTSHFISDRYVLVDFNVSDISDIFMEADNVISDETRRLIEFIIENVSAELLEGKYPYFGGEVGMDYMFLLSIPEGGDEETVCRELVEMTGRVGLFLRESYGLNIWVNISSIHRGRQEIALCRDEINDLNLYRDWAGTSLMVLHYSDLANNDELLDAGAYYKEKQARDYIRIHEYKAAVALLTELQGREEEAGEGEAERREESQNEGRSACCQMREIAAYIDEHYTDKMLSAGQLADIFGMSPSNLSQTFKRKMNVGLLDYINQARLKKAKELLENGMTMKDTADEVGYYTTRPLIRVFYSVEGVSPAEYRTRFTKGTDSAE